MAAGVTDRPVVEELVTAVGAGRVADALQQVQVPVGRTQHLVTPEHRAITIQCIHTSQPTYVFFYADTQTRRSAPECYSSIGCLWETRRYSPLLRPRPVIF